MKPTIGRTLHYILTADDSQAIKRRRFGTIDENFPKRAQAHVGNSVGEGEHVALTVTAVWPNEYGDGIPGVNGQALLDGNDSLWVTSAKEGTTPGTWHWPEREE